jgi:uncharacterized protein YuzE
MKITDPEMTDLLYIRLDERPQQVTNREVDDDIVLDLGEDDRIVGIEILDCLETPASGPARIYRVSEDGLVARVDHNPHGDTPTARTSRRNVGVNRRSVFSDPQLVPVHVAGHEIHLRDPQAVMAGEVHVHATARREEEACVVLDDSMIVYDRGPLCSPQADEAMTKQRRSLVTFRELWSEQELKGFGPLRAPTRLHTGVTVLRTKLAEDDAEIGAHDDYRAENEADESLLAARKLAGWQQRIINPPAVDIENGRPKQTIDFREFLRVSGRSACLGQQKSGHPVQKS